MPKKVIGLRNRRTVRDGGIGATLRNADLLDGLIDILGLKNDAALARALDVSPPILSKIRHGGRNVSASTLIRMHEVSGLNIYELRACMGDHRRRFGIPD